MEPVVIAIIVIVILVLALGVRTVRIVPQARVGIIQRLGNYRRTAESGVAVVIPFIDRMLPLVDMRAQVVSFPPQPVITSDNVTINVTSVIYYQIIDAKSAAYQLANLLAAMEQLTQTPLRNVIGLACGAVNGSNPSPEAMAYQYLQMLPKLAENPANKVLVVPTDYAGLVGLATTLGAVGADGVKANGGRPPTAPSTGATIPG